MPGKDAQFSAECWRSHRAARDIIQYHTDFVTASAKIAPWMKKISQSLIFDLRNWSETFEPFYTMVWRIEFFCIDPILKELWWNQQNRCVLNYLWPNWHLSHFPKKEPKRTEIWYYLTIRHLSFLHFKETYLEIRKRERYLVLRKCKRNKTRGYYYRSGFISRLLSPAPFQLITRVCCTSQNTKTTTLLYWHKDEEEENWASTHQSADKGETWSICRLHLEHTMLKIQFLSKKNLEIRIQKFFI